MIDPLHSLLDEWPVSRVSAVVIADGSVVASGGDGNWSTRLASISKLLTAYAGLVAVEAGTITLDQPAGRAGSTVRHLLAHAAGYAFDSRETVAEVGVRRIYSNGGIELFADIVAEAAGVAFGEYLRTVVLAPLGMSRSELRGSPAHAVESTAWELAAFARELEGPTLIHQSTLDMATSVQFPDLAGVLPGVGRFDPNPWGLGFEIKGGKDPHWSGTSTSPQTFGHFGGAGTFMWVDPQAKLSVIALTDRAFDSWAMRAWPIFSDEMVRRYGATPPSH